MTVASLVLLYAALMANAAYHKGDGGFTRKNAVTMVLVTALGCAGAPTDRGTCY